MGLKQISLAAVALSFLGTAALAHHSFAMFDNTKMNYLEGTVVEFEWINPHAWFHITAVDAQGRNVRWSFEMGSVSQLVRDRWQQDTVKVGEKVTVGFHPLRDGSHGGQFRTLKFADGRTICQAGAGNAPCDVNNLPRPGAGGGG
jgi:hypothetical protein